MNELYIDDRLVDLGADTKVGLTLQVNDIAEMVDRQGTFSNTFKTPKSKTNKEIYEHAELVNSVTSKPYRKLPAKYIQDGIELVQSGYSEFKSAGDFYEQTIFGGILDFFSQINGKKLSDLDLTEFDHVWDLDTVFNSRVNTEGYIYALIEWSDDIGYMPNSAREVYAGALFQCMFVHTLISKIFEGTTYTIGGDLVSTDKYRKRLFPFQLDKLENSAEFVSAQTFRVSVLPVQNYVLPLTTVPAPPLVSPFAGRYYVIPKVIFNNETSGGSFDTGDNFASGLFTARFKGSYRFTFSITYSTSNTGSGTPNTGLYVRFKNQSAATVHTDNESFVGHATNRVFQTTSGFIIMNAGDTIQVELEFFSILSSGNFTWTIHPETFFKNEMSNSILFGSDIVMSGLMPNMTQEELIKSVAIQLGIIFEPDNVNKVIYFKQMGDVYENIPKAINMTNKLDMSKEIKVSFREGGYAQKNWLRYKENTEVTKSGLIPTKGLGDGSFRIADENLDLEKDLFVLPFTATEDVIRMTGLGVCRIPKLNAGTITNKTGLRMVMLNRVNITGGDLRWHNIGSDRFSSADIPLTYFIDDTKLDSLGFDRFLLSVEYSQFIDQMLNNFKKVEGKFKLSVKDVQNFDFFIPWYLDQYSNHFYVNKIKSFISGKLTSVELIRM